MSVSGHHHFPPLVFRSWFWCSKSSTFILNELMASWTVPPVPNHGYFCMSFCRWTQSYLSELQKNFKLKHSASQHGEFFSTRTRAFNKVGQEPIRNFIGRSWPSPVDPMSRLTRESETSTRRHTDTSASSKNLKCSLGFTTLMVSSDIRYQIAPFCLCISWWRSHQNKWRILHIGEWLRSRILLE